MSYFLIISECVLWFVGFLILFSQSWKISLGVFLLLWANNLEWRRKIKSNDNSQHNRERV